MLINHVTRQMTAKVVYYGPAFSGKTTNLQFIYDSLPATEKGKLLSLVTKTDRTLFFDFTPAASPTIRDFRLHLQLYTVPGHVAYNTTLRLVLKGADAVVFVADSAPDRLDANHDSLSSLLTDLESLGIALSDITLVVQFNKRDVPNAMAVDALRDLLGISHLRFTEAVAVIGEGVLETLDLATELLAERLTAKRTVAITPEEPLWTIDETPTAAFSPPPPSPPPPPAYAGFSFDVPFASQPLALPDLEVGGDLAQMRMPVAAPSAEKLEMTDFEAIEAIMLTGILARVFPVADRNAMERRMRAGLSFRSWILNHRVGEPWRVRFTYFDESLDDDASVQFSIDRFVQRERVGDHSLSLLAVYPSGAVRGVSAEISSVNDNLLVSLTDPLSLIDPENPNIWPVSGQGISGEVEMIALRGAL